MEIPEELASQFKFARQKSKLAGTIRGSYFVVQERLLIARSIKLPPRSPLSASGQLWADAWHVSCLARNAGSRRYWNLSR